MNKREIKFRYRLERITSREIVTKIFTIRDIESHGFSVWYENYNVLSRDRFTGLKDKNGVVDVYEGDIVEFKSEGTKERCGYFTGTICWNNDHACFQIEVNGMEYPFLMSDDVDSFQSKSTALGNIYENPELLEEADE